MKRVRALFALGLLFVLLAALVAGCDIPTLYGNLICANDPAACVPAPSSSHDLCCKVASAPWNYSCYIPFNLPCMDGDATCVQPMCGVTVKAKCFANQAAADTNATAYAQKHVPQGAEFTPIVPVCQRALCPSSQRPVAPRRLRASPPEQHVDGTGEEEEPGDPGLMPFDLPACSDMGTGGSSTACISGSDACSTCLNGCCDEYAACVAAEGAQACQEVIGYWQGSNPEPEGVTGTPIDDLNNCATTACGDPGTCTAYVLIEDGGLGFGGGTP